MVDLEATIKRFRGTSVEDKPRLITESATERGELLIEDAQIPVGSTFTEVDTGAKYIWRGQSWELQEQSIAAMFEALMQVNLDMLSELRAIRMAAAIQANGAWDAQIPTVR